MPGTRWCGTGNVSTAGQSYGNVLATDRCCQQHDRCAHTIDSFSRNYGLFNYRLHTISHCECDDVYVSRTSMLVYYGRPTGQAIIYLQLWFLLVHGQVTIIFVVCWFVCLSVCLCRVFLSRL